MNELMTINKLHAAKLAVQEVKELDEIKRLIDQSEALRNYARAQKLGQEIQDDVIEYTLYATRQMGLISIKLETAQGARSDLQLSAEGAQSKTDALTSAGIEPRRAYEAEKLAAASDEEFAEILAEKRESGTLTKTAVMEALSKPESQRGSNNECNSPIAYIESARLVMGEIDLDPASSEEANKIIGAGAYYTKENDGLAKDWRGRVWLHPPSSVKLMHQFVKKLITHYRSGEVVEAIVLTNNSTETKWFSVLAGSASAMVFPKGRGALKNATGLDNNKPVQGQAITYFGENPDKFLMEFSKYGFGVRLWSVRMGNGGDSSATG